jgi:predicted nucleic acid-binding Zn ribbon protein
MDKPLKKCPECGRRSFERKIGAGAGIIFKGSGFYETDYRSESYKSDARKDKESSTGSTGSSDSKAKPETKSPSPNGASENKGKASGGKMKAAS